MSASRTRSYLRKARQQSNKSSLTAADKLKNPIAIRAYILHGGRRGNGSGGAFAVFAKRFPLANDKVKAPKHRNRALHHILLHISYVREVLKRRARNKRARKQRARA
jgi:hypothetical protein